MEYSLYISSILALGILAQWLAWRMQFPSIVLLLVFGFILGYFTDQTPGPAQDVFFAFVSLSVGIILFEGGLSLDFREIQGVRGVLFRLVSLGLVVTWLLTAWLAHRVAGFSAEMALLLGALLTVSGPTVIMPLLRQVQPAKRIGSLIKWEGIVNDPIGAVLAAIVFELILHRNTESIASGSLVSLGLTLLTALVLSSFSAFLILQMLKKYLVPDFLQNPLVLALVVFVFALSNHLQAESGLVTITLLGVLLANQHTVPIKHIVEFKENLRTLLISTLFIVLAARVNFSWESLEMLGWRSVLFVGALNPGRAAGGGAGVDRRESTQLAGTRLLAWMHPRGIVAAAVSSLFGLEIVRVLGPEDPLALETNRFVLTVFLVIVATVTVYGLTISWVARKLGLSRQNPQGILFAGASPAACEIAAAIMKEGYTVMVVDTNPRNNSAARMAGLPVIFASIGSEMVREQTDLGGIGRLLAMTPNDEVNTLASMAYTERFGRSEVYQLATGESSSVRSERKASYRQGRTLFAKGLTFDQLQSRFAKGQRIKSTLLSTDFTYDDFLEHHGESALVLFRIDESGKLLVVTNETELNCRPGQKLIALVDAEEEKGTERPSPSSAALVDGLANQAGANRQRA